MKSARKVESPRTSKNGITTDPPRLHLPKSLRVMFPYIKESQPFKAQNNHKLLIKPSFRRKNSEGPFRDLERPSLALAPLPSKTSVQTLRGNIQ